MIVCLRDPVARAYSHWRMEVARKRESLTFSCAIREGRSRVSAALESQGQHRVFSYVERSFYANQIRRLLKHFPRTQVLFLTRVELLYRQRSVLDSICLFLDVSAFEEYPSPQIIHSYETATIASPLPGDVQYLRDLFKDDLSITESLINQAVELEYP